tara:strand:- start:21286 stop:22029 length:744 start_codon:yes stop_codon:yes gene_type:complete
VRIRLAPLVLFVLVASCAPESNSSSGKAHVPATVTARTLPSRWDTATRREFEDVALRLTARKPEWTAADLEELDAALAGQDERAARASVLLAHDPRPACSQVMLAHLELRRDAPGRPWDAAAIVCADALEHRTLAGDQVERLAALAAGPAPHPDLEVRIACASAALAHGDRSVAPFLIRVLRAETPAQAEDPPDWERVTTLFWAKRHASGALSEALGTPLTFRPDGSWEHQMNEAAAYEAAMRLAKD